MNIQEFLQHLNGVKRTGGGFTALCPGHEDKQNSLSISEGEKGIVLHCHAGCDTEHVLNTMGLQARDLFFEPLEQPKKQQRNKKTVVAEYTYTDEQGEVLYKSIRYKPKGFSQCKPDPNKPGKWISNLQGIQTVLYNLPAVKQAIEDKERVFIVEGEKDVETLGKIGLTGTTNPMGAGKWKKHYSDSLIGADCVLIPDNDSPGREHALKVARALYQKADSIKIVILPDLPEKGDFTDFHNRFEDGEEAKKSLLQLVEDTEPYNNHLREKESSTSNEADREAYKPLNQILKKARLPYFVCDRGTFLETDGGNKLLANFVMVPKEFIKKDNGVEEVSLIMVKGMKSNSSLKAVTVPASKYGGMNWILDNWGFEANISVGQTVKEHLRYVTTAIGEEKAVKKTVYAHTGWREIDNQMVYLYNGGAIGKDNVCVELENELQKYSFPEAVNNEKEALTASYCLLDAAPVEVAFPLLAFTYLSPLNHFLKAGGVEPSFIIFLLGPTGSFKSSLAAAFLCHFGTFTEKGLPSSFKDTANAIERKGTLLKDTLTVLDDYIPTKQKSDAKRMDAIAQAITRAYGDRTGRSRLNADSNLKETYVPKGNLIMTGEDLPQIGESGIGRHLVLELSKGQITFDGIRRTQEKNPLFNGAMRGYIEWLQPQAKELEKTLPNLFRQYRKEETEQRENAGHKRQPDTTAFLRMGFYMFLSYCVHVGIISGKEKNEVEQQALKIFRERAEGQSDRVKEEKPCKLFLDAFKELEETGGINLFPVDTVDKMTLDSCKQIAGYYDKEFYYLHAMTVYNEVCEFFARRNERFPISQRMLLKQLAQEGYSEPEVNGKTKVIKVCGESKRVLRLKRSAVDIQFDVKSGGIPLGITP